MNKKEHLTEGEAIARLKRNGIAAVNPNYHKLMTFTKNLIGNGNWAAIDCLVNHHKYTRVYNTIDLNKH